jgi:tetratricopeptide (TPR) repeat protein
MRFRLHWQPARLKRTVFIAAILLLVWALGRQGQRPDAPRQVLLATAAARLEARQYRAALAAAQKAVTAADEARDDDLRFAALNIGAQCNGEMNRPREAAACLEAALRLRPDDLVTANNLAYRYAETGSHLEKAAILARRAARMRPWNAAFVDTLGWVHFKAKRYDAALRELRKGVRLLPDDPTLRRHLAALFRAVGDNQAARIELQKAAILERLRGL